LATAIVLLLVVWGPVARAAPPSSADQPEAAPSPHGFLWEAHKAQRHALLMGTLHVGLASDYPPDRSTQQRLSGVDVIVLEADLSQAERTLTAMQARALYGPDEPGLDTRIDAGLKADTRRVLDQVGFAAEPAWRMKPWMLALTLEILLAAKQGYSPAYASETYLMSLAESSGKPVAELEGVEAQFELLDTPPWPEQVDFLRQSVHSILDGQAEQELRTLLAAWRSSDEPAMQQYLQSVRNSPDPTERVQFERLITRRNAIMAERIDRMLDDGRFYLVAVGSLHYFGPDGLLAALRARGYAVTPVSAGRSP
jgi:uncharacterized protein YbaP (TraB family)